MVHARKILGVAVAIFALGVLTACATDDGAQTGSKNTPTVKQTAVSPTPPASEKKGCLAKTPFPANFAIEQPGEDVPADMAKFVNSWGDGDWHGLGMCTALIIQKVGKDGRVTALYSNGPYRTFISPRYREVTGTIENGVFTTMVDNKFEVRYWFDPEKPNVLKGKFFGKNGVYDTELAPFNKNDIPS